MWRFFTETVFRLLYLNTCCAYTYPQVSVYFRQVRVQRREGVQRTGVERQVFVQRPERGDCRRHGCGPHAVGRHWRLIEHNKIALQKFCLNFFSTRTHTSFEIKYSFYFVDVSPSSFPPSPHPLFPSPAQSRRHGIYRFDVSKASQAFDDA